MIFDLLNFEDDNLYEAFQRNTVQVRTLNREILPSHESDNVERVMSQPRALAPLAN